MLPSPALSWAPSEIRSVIKLFNYDSLPVLVETDIGPAFYKVPNDKVSPHRLACELIGLQAAKWLGLVTPDFHLMPVPDFPPIRLESEAKPLIGGTGILLRRLKGNPWAANVNLPSDVPDMDFAKLVIFDTWLLNCDRHHPGGGPGGEDWANHENVFLTTEGAHPGHQRLVAMDQGHCFSCGDDLTYELLIKSINNKTIYGKFNEFGFKIHRTDIQNTIAVVECIENDVGAGFVDRVPPEWLSEEQCRTALVEVIYQRARALRGLFEEYYTPLSGS